MIHFNNVKLLGRKRYSQVALQKTQRDKNKIYKLIKHVKRIYEAEYTPFPQNTKAL